MWAPARSSNNMTDGRKIIALVVASPLTQNIFDRIGVDLMSETFKVVVIDCLNWISGKAQQLSYHKVNYSDILEVNGESDFHEAIKKIHPQFVLDYIGRGPCTRTVQDVCRKFGALYIMQLLTPAPHPISKSNLRYSFRQHPVETLIKTVRYLARKLGRPEPLPPDVALLAGDASNSDWSDAAAARIYTATPDFFELRRIEQKINRTGFEVDTLVKDSYILFVDDCLAMSFDYVLGNYQHVFEVREYFSLINGFFAELERYFGLPVVIAAHPNGKEYREYDKLFGGRKVLFGSTAELTWGCKFVVSHFSSALSFAVLLRKKILLLSAIKLKNTTPGMMIDYISTQLRCPQANIDDVTSVVALVEFENSGVNEWRYLAYERKYVTSTDDPGEHPYENLLKYLSTNVLPN